MMPLVGFLPASDPRVKGTIEAIERDLTVDGFVSRYRTVEQVDGLPPGEASFLLCSFWLVDNLELLGPARRCAAAVRAAAGGQNDVGLLAEGYDVEARRLAGNFPQAFSHVGLVNTAMNLSRKGVAPALERAG
jgi:GH15 family glucan-1,4-alpha-glucosidase